MWGGRPFPPTQASYFPIGLLMGLLLGEGEGSFRGWLLAGPLLSTRDVSMPRTSSSVALLTAAKSLLSTLSTMPAPSFCPTSCGGGWGDGFQRGR